MSKDSKVLWAKCWRRLGTEIVDISGVDHPTTYSDHFDCHRVRSDSIQDFLASTDTHNIETVEFFRALPSLSDKGELVEPESVSGLYVVGAELVTDIKSEDISPEKKQALKQQKEDNNLQIVKWIFPDKTSYLGLQDGDVLVGRQGNVLWPQTDANASLVVEKTGPPPPNP